MQFGIKLIMWDVEVDPFDTLDDDDDVDDDCRTAFFVVGFRRLCSFSRFQCMITLYHLLKLEPPSKNILKILQIDDETIFVISKSFKPFQNFPNTFLEMIEQEHMKWLSLVKAA